VSAQPTPVSTSRDFAVVVGIGLYSQASCLDGPDHDTDDIVEWLVDDEKIPRSNVFQLRSRDYAAQYQNRGKGAPRVPPPAGHPRPMRSCVDSWFATKVIGPLKALIQAGKQPEHGWDRLILYFAGHGGWNKTQPDDALLFGAPAEVVEGDVVDEVELIHLRQIVHFFHESTWFREIVLIVDACREARKWKSSYTTDDLKWDTLSHRLKKWPERDVSYFLAYAARRGQVVEERRIGPRRRGVFTYFFRHALRRARRTSDGRVDATVLASYLDAALTVYYTSEGALPTPTPVARHRGAHSCSPSPRPHFFPFFQAGPIRFKAPHPDPAADVQVFFQLDRTPRPGDKDAINLAVPSRSWQLLVRPAGAGWDAGVAVPIESDNAASAGPFPANPGVVYESTLGYTPPPAKPVASGPPQTGLIPPAGWVEVRTGRFRLVRPPVRKVSKSYRFGSGGPPTAGTTATDGVRDTPHSWGVTHVRV